MFADDTILYHWICTRLSTTNLMSNTQIYTLFLVSNAFELFVRHGLHSHLLSFSYCDFYLQGIFKNIIHEIEANKAELLNTITEFFLPANLVQIGAIQLGHFSDHFCPCNSLWPDLPYTVHASNPCWRLSVPTAAHSRVSIFSPLIWLPQLGMTAKHQTVSW